MCKQIDPMMTAYIRFEPVGCLTRHVDLIRHSAGEFGVISRLPNQP
jgi:hypothetical protein